ncbi:hypothetical protein [Paracoccus sediminilitoris]|uniref:hypothetical protein n=1 Tax=Paracoccus sediminilitoris TaxID=2202419 RepID=UPI0011B94A77|nr:hypothetical protein [Paracoccus sediminilitoris]
MTTNPTTVPDFTIHNLNIINSEPNKIGNRLLAVFDLWISGLKVCGCVLTEKNTGIVTAHGPIGKTHRGDNVRIHLADPALGRAVTRRVAMAYVALTGFEVADE